MSHATPEDVGVYLQRPLTAEEAAAAQAFLDVLEIIISREIKNFDSQLTNAEFSKAVKYVEASVAADAVRNPDRYQYEQAGDYAYSLQQGVKVESLRSSITDDMWWLLGRTRRGAFTIETAVFSGPGGRTPRWWTPTYRTFQ